MSRPEESLEFQRAIPIFNKTTICKKLTEEIHKLMNLIWDKGALNNIENTKDRSLLIIQKQKPRTFLNFLFESMQEGKKYLEQDFQDGINTIAIAVSQKVYEELNQIHGSNDSKYVPITYDDIKSIKLLERVIKETLRLFPPDLVIPRKVKKDI
ncbi:cytochrome P450 4C1-like [Vespa mandarinia]|uniref:cytochrome P450 4C1-like n=1 Tax=Vespa mandarinia TaxID=7446 RepID=UPI0016110E3F|nr:cytochrome P450 4C1-like [Vespa mandarinia]